MDGLPSVVDDDFIENQPVSSHSPEILSISTDCQEVSFTCIYIIYYYCKYLLIFFIINKYILSGIVVVNLKCIFIL